MLTTQEALVITMTSAPADVSIYEVYPWTSSLNAKLILGSLLDTFYNHLKFSMFKTQLIISTFPSVFSFFFHLCVLLWSTSLPTPTLHLPLYQSLSRPETYESSVTLSSVPHLFIWRLPSVFSTSEICFELSPLFFIPAVSP